MVANFSKKRKGEFSTNKLLLQLAGIFLIIIIAVLVFADFKIYKKRKKLESQISIYQNQIEELEKANKGIKDEIANSDNIDYLEKIAYEQLGEQKPGEKGVIFITPKEENKEAPVPENFWTAWFSGVWSWIKSKF